MVSVPGREGAEQWWPNPPGNRSALGHGCRGHLHPTCGTSGVRCNLAVLTLLQINLQQKEPQLQPCSLYSWTSFLPAKTKAHIKKKRHFRKKNKKKKEKKVFLNFFRNSEQPLVAKNCNKSVLFPRKCFLCVGGAERASGSSACLLLSGGGQMCPVSHVGQSHKTPSTDATRGSIFLETRARTALASSERKSEHTQLLQAGPGSSPVPSAHALCPPHHRQGAASPVLLSGQRKINHKPFWAAVWGAGTMWVQAGVSPAPGCPLTLLPLLRGLWKSPSLSPECQCQPQGRMFLAAIPP